MTVTTLAPAAVAEVARPAYRVPSFRRYALGQAVSVLGDQVWYVALSWAAVQVVSPGAAGLLMAVSAIPRLVLMLAGGVLVDRADPRRLMVDSDLVRAVVCLAAAAVAVWQPGVAVLVAVALVFGAADAVFLPAAAALQPRLLEPAQYAGGNALVATFNRTALTFGAPIGGLLAAVGGLPLALVVNAATFVVSIVALRSVRPHSVTGPATPAVRPRQALRDGLSYLARHRVLRGVVLVSLLANVGFAGPMNVGLALAAQAHGWGAGGIGAMLSGFGVGAIVAGLTMMRLKPRRGVGVVVATCFAIQGVAVVLPALVTSLPVAVAATALAGLTSGPAAVLLSALVQTSTDDAYRGRVASVTTVVNLGLTPLAMAAMGVLAGACGLVPAFAASGALELVAAAMCLAVPAIRRARLA
ncbi:MAG: MFS transporter [Hamadaea sp.]|nr:MFS transporter [Hamadaea sp.]